MRAWENTPEYRQNLCYNEVMLRTAFLSLVLFTSIFTLANDAVIERYRELLVQSPKKGAIFDRVYGHYVDTGQSATFYQDLLTATQNKPNDAGTWMLFGLIAERRNRTEQAAEAYTTAATLEPEHHLPMLYLGELLLNQRRVYEAIAAFEEANERLAKHTGSRVDRRAVLQALALAYSRFGEPQKSLDVWNQLAALFPNDPDILVQVAESMEFDGKLDEALKQYRRLLTITDDNFERVRLSLAAIDIMLRLGDDEEALRDLNTLLGFVHSDSYLADAVRDRIDRIFNRRRNQNQHIDFYQKRIAQEPNDVASLLRLVRIFQRADRSTEAETLLLDTIKVSPSNAALRLTLIDMLVARRDIGGAVEQFQAMNRVTTDHLIRWGTLLLQHPGMAESERRTEAAKIWHRITENAPNDPVAAVMVADIFARNRFNDEAERLYKRAIDLRPNEFSHRESLAVFYHQQSQKDKVLETLLSGDQSEIGRVLLTMGYLDEATETLREAVRANPQNGTVQSRYLEALLRQNTPESIQTIRALFVNAERQIASDEQYALFLHQNVQLMRSMQRVSEGVRIVQSIVETTPSVRSLWFLAMLHQAEANFFSAIATLEKALETADGRRQTAEEHLPLLRFAAELYEQSGDTNKAIALYQTLVHKDPARSGDHWQRIITLQIQRGELAQALESSRNLLGRGTENAERLRFVADLFLTANRRTEAIGLLRQALIHEPGNTDVLRILAQTLADSEQHEEAIELFWRLYERLEHFPAKLSVIEILATQYNQLDRDDDLVERLQLLSRNYDRRREAMQCLVRVYVLRGDYDEAQSVLEDMLDMPDDTAAGEMSLWVLRELVSIAERQGDFAAAAQYQETLVQKSSDSGEQQHLFYLYDKLGDTAGTRKLFFEQVLRQGTMEARFELIDAMIRQGQFDIVTQVLEFLEIHEPEHWQVAFRRILVEAHQNKPVGNLVREFRDKAQERMGVSPPVIQQTTLLTENRGANAAPLVRALHPTFIFSAAAPPELNASLIRQKHFLRTLFFPEIRWAHRSPERERLPEGFADVPTFQDARFLTLGWLLREAIVKDLTTFRDDPAVMQHFCDTVEELRAMLPFDSTEHNVLMERLRLEVFLLDLIEFDAELQELRFQELRVRIEPEKLLRMQLDERTCQHAIAHIVRQWALDGVPAWRSTLFQILIDECIAEQIFERFKTVLHSDARLSEMLQQKLDNLCVELKIPAIPAEERNEMVNYAARLVKRLTALHQTHLRQNSLTLPQKTERLLELWRELIEHASPKAREQYRVHFTSRLRTFLWILHSQNRDADVVALEQSLRKTAQNDPLSFTKDIIWLTQSFDENLMLFRLANYEPLETQLHRIITFASDFLTVSEDKELNRAVGDILFRNLGGPYNLLHSSRLQRYDVFTQQELRSVLETPAQQVWNDLYSPTQTQQGRLVRQVVGVDVPDPVHTQTLTPDQLARLAEWDNSLQQLTEFAFYVLDELKLVPTDFAQPLPMPKVQNVSLSRFRSELQGDRPVDRSVIFSLLQRQETTGNFSAVDELFFRIILLRRVMDAKTKSLGMRVDDRGKSIQANNAETLRQFIESKRLSTVPSDQIWGEHFAELFGDLLRMDAQTANRPALDADAELLQIVQRLETTDGRQQTAAEQLALALIYVRLQRFDDAVTMLDAMELTVSTDLSMREWIIANLARKRGSPDTPLMRRGSRAVDRLTNFRLSERESLHLVSVLRFFNRDDEAQRILDNLATTVSEHRLLAELLNQLISEGESQKENAARIARRILTNPAFLQNTQRLTAEVLLMETALRALGEHNQVESVVPMLESRLRAHRDKTDSRILLARLYLVVNRQDDARALALELAQNPTAEAERRQMIVSMLVQFGLQRELEAMNRLLLEQNNR